MNYRTVCFGDASASAPAPGVVEFKATAFPMFLPVESRQHPGTTLNYRKTCFGDASVMTETKTPVAAGRMDARITTTTTTVLPPPVESPLQRNERLSIAREDKIRTERMERERRIRLADHQREAKEKKYNKISNQLWSHSHHASDASDDLNSYHNSSSPVAKFETTLRRYHRSLGSRLLGQEKYVRPMVDPLIEAIDRSMGQYDNEIYKMLCQERAEFMTRQFCADHPIQEFDAALVSGAITKGEAVGILGFHVDTEGVKSLTKKHGLELTTMHYRQIVQRAKDTGCLTQAQLEKADFKGFNGVRR